MFFGINLSNWLCLNCKSQQPCALDIPWGILFPIGVWNLWLHQNRVVFLIMKLLTRSPNLIFVLAEYAFLGVNERKKRNLGILSSGSHPHKIGTTWIQTDLLLGILAVLGEGALFEMLMVNGWEVLLVLLEPLPAL